MNTKILDKKIEELKMLEDKISTLELFKIKLRKEVFDAIEKNGFDQYKSDIATVSYVERKAVKIEDEEALLKDLEKQRLVKFFEVVPAHKELKPYFQEQIKQGAFKHRLVKVETTKNLAIRFLKGGEK